MLPTAITLWNYRSFATPVSLELRPLTLLYGINNAGKSALLRALPILSESLGPEASSPLHLEGPAAFGTSFRDLRWKGVEADEDPDLNLQFNWDGKDHLDFALTWFEDWRRLIIRRFLLHDPLGVCLFEAEWVPRPEERSARELTYSWRAAPLEGTLADSVVSQGTFSFQGLLPETMPEDCEERLGEPASRLRALRHQVQWITAARSKPPRISQYFNGPRWRLGHDGRDAASLLASDSEILAEVSAWYERHFGRALAIQEMLPDRFRLILQNRLRAELDIDLLDTGEGMIQALPVLTALALARRRSQGGPGILAIEEPESHLHPRLQRALAEEICALARESSPPRIVLETHSEHVLLGVQREIATGRLSPQDVVVYWVQQLETGESVADRVTYDEKARPQGAWPPGVFDDVTEVAREIIEARWEHDES
jgi:predicted ATPase